MKLAREPSAASNKPAGRARRTPTCCDTTRWCRPTPGIGAPLSGTSDVPTGLPRADGVNALAADYGRLLHSTTARRDIGPTWFGWYSSRSFLCSSLQDAERSVQDYLCLYAAARAYASSMESPKESRGRIGVSGTGGGSSRKWSIALANARAVGSGRPGATFTDGLDGH